MNVYFLLLEKQLFSSSCGLIDLLFITYVIYLLSAFILFIAHRYQHHLSLELQLRMMQLLKNYLNSLLFLCLKTTPTSLNTHTHLGVHTQLPADHKISFKSGAVFIRFKDKVVMLQTQCGYTGGVKRTWEGFTCHHGISPRKIVTCCMGNSGPQIVNTPTSQNFQPGFCGYWMHRSKFDFSKRRHADRQSLSNPET